MLGNSVIAALGRTAACWALFMMGSAFAQQAPPAAEQPDPAEAVRNAARAAMLKGPQEISLVDQAKLTLPEGYSFVPKKEGAAVMQLMGNRTDDKFIGLIFPETDAQWLAIVEYESSGYIEDSEAKDWDAEELLDSLKAGTQQANEERKDLGIAPLEVTKWVEVPTYDSAQQRLVWSVEAREIGAQDSDPIINYNTHVLGREGY